MLLPEFLGKLLVSQSCVDCDDLTLSGPRAEHKAFWDELTALVDLEPPELLLRVLGRSLRTRIRFRGSMWLA